MTSQPAPDTPAAADAHRTWGLSASDRWLVTLLLWAGALLLGFWAWRLSGWGQAEIEITRLPAHQYDYQIDLNRAGWVELALLEGIGETLAKRIVADREANGRFAEVDALDRVKGIGPKTLARIRPWLTVQPEPATRASDRQ